MAIDALRNLTWAAGFDFEGVPPPDGRYGWRFAQAGVRSAQRLQQMRQHAAMMARYQAATIAGLVDSGALPRPEGTGPALVYLVAHPVLGATKVGVSESGGTRIVQHRRQGWHLVAAFQVTASADVSIERSVLRWWRSDLGLPVHVESKSMPQGGWTETVATAGIDLGATVARICELAVSPGARHDSGHE